MRIIIEIASDTDDQRHTAESIEGAKELVESLQRQAESWRRQGMPGACWVHGDGTVWVASARLDFD